MTKLRAAVLISGRGSNMKALIDAAAAADYPAEIALVISDVAGAAGLGVAEAAGVRAKTVDRRTFGAGAEGRRAFEDALTAALEGSRAELICLAGFMRMLSAPFVDEWRGRIVNIHPSLLPAFKGLDTHAEMLRAGVKIAGCTVHYVTQDMDGGPIIGQAAVPVRAGDTAQSLAARILAEEHRLYPECVRKIAAGEVRLTPAGVVELSGAQGDGALLNPAPVRSPL